MKLQAQAMQQRDIDTMILAALFRNVPEPRCQVSFIFPSKRDLVLQHVSTLQ